MLSKLKWKINNYLFGKYIPFGYTKEYVEKVNERTYPFPLKDDNVLELKVKKLCTSAKLPTKAYEHDAGLDIYCRDSFALPRMGNQLNDSPTYKVRTGIAIEIPQGFVGLIFDRGSLRSGGIHKSAGVMDSGFRNEWLICLTNHTKETKIFKAGDKIAQVLILPVPNVRITEVTELSESERGLKMLGSSGK